MASPNYIAPSKDARFAHAFTLMAKFKEQGSEVGDITENQARVWLANMFRILDGQEPTLSDYALLGFVNPKNKKEKKDV